MWNLVVNGGLENGFAADHQIDYCVVNLRVPAPSLGYPNKRRVYAHSSHGTSQRKNQQDQEPFQG